MTKRKSFSAEFKREAVRLLETAQKSSADLARELGVRRNQQLILLNNPLFTKIRDDEND
jgi:transposase-like protein